MHQQKTYFDRQLPLGQVITTTTTSSNISRDPREVARLDSQTTKRQFGGERIELFCLTGNTIGESNTMQLEMAHAIIDLHQSLLVSSSCRDVTLRTATPTELLPCEASRVVVEGIIGEKASVTLGYVSNMTDYCTRGTQTKIGGAMGYCFSVHGVMCSILETVEWMLKQNIVEDNGELGIGVPPPLSIHLQEQLEMATSEGVLFVPFSRRIHRGKKNGTFRRTEIDKASKPRVIPTNGRGSMGTQSSRPNRGLLAPLAKGPPTAQQIRDERLSCPFDFLPIGR